MLCTYDIELLGFIASHRYAPYCIDELANCITIYPVTPDTDQLKEMFEALIKRGYLRIISVPNGLKAIDLTLAGERVVIANEIPISARLYDSKDLLRKYNQQKYELMFCLSDYKNLTKSELVKSNGYDSYGTHFQMSKIQGFIKSKSGICYMGYAINSRNPIIHIQTEHDAWSSIRKIHAKPDNSKIERFILVGDSVEMISKLVKQNPSSYFLKTTGDSYDRTRYLFDSKELDREYYFTYFDLKQMKSTYRFFNQKAEETINGFIYKNHEEEVHNDIRDRDFLKEIGTPFRDSACETDHAVYFQIHTQNINKLRRMYTAFKAIGRGERMDSRKIYIYVDDVCEPIFDVLFNEFKFVEKLTMKIKEETK